MAKALSTKKRIPQNEHKELVPVLDDLSHDPGIKLDQMKSLIIVCEAMKEFPRHIVELCIKSLTPNKRQRLIEFVSSSVLKASLSIIIQCYLLVDMVHPVWNQQKGVHRS